MEFFTESENKARSVLASVSLASSSVNELRVRNVFWAMWSSSLPAERVEAISSAIEGGDVLSLKMALSNLVRRKVLRSRTVSGVKLYEINF